MKKLKKDGKSRKYQLTINNPLGKDSDGTASTGEQIIFDHEEIKKRLNNLSSITYWCMADERGEKEQTHHTHIFFYSPNAIRFSTVKKQFPTAHVEAAYGSCTANRDYVGKSGKWKETGKSKTSIEDTFEEGGTIPSTEQKGNSAGIQYAYELMENGFSDAEILRLHPESMLHLDKIQRARLTLLEDEMKNQWRDVFVTYIYGATNTGKTRSVMEQFGYENVYRITDYAHPWDTYKMQDVVLFEEFRSSLRIQDMLSYLDGYPCTLPARYANKQAGFTKVFITTNIPLHKQYAEVQECEPETWAAFLRRISKVQHFWGDGAIDSYDSVQDYLRFHTSKNRQDCTMEVKGQIDLTGKEECVSDREFNSLMSQAEGGGKDESGAIF